MGAVPVYLLLPFLSVLEGGKRSGQDPARLSGHRMRIIIPSELLVPGNHVTPICLVIPMKLITKQEYRQYFWKGGQTLANVTAKGTVIRQSNGRKKEARPVEGQGTQSLASLKTKMMET